MSLLLLLFVALIVQATSLAWRTRQSPPVSQPWVSDLASVSAGMEASREQVERTCGTCHAYPPPELFPKLGWPHEVDRGFRFLREGSVPADTPSFASVVAYYQRRAPELLPVLKRMVAPHEFPVQFERAGYRPARGLPSPGVANVRFVHLSDERKLDVLACDMVNGLVLLLKPYEPKPELRIVTDAVSHPAHAEVIDLDHDGIKDLLVANLGSPTPTDDRVGSVVWLKGVPDGSFTPVTLAGGLGRVADAQAADFDGDGDLDLAVAEFGWLKTGRILLLENRTTDASRPVFVPSTIDPRHGAIHVLVTELNGDGRPEHKLLEGSPMGRTRDAAPGAPADRPVPQLLAMGLLRRVDAETVILPRHVGQVLRGEDPGPMRLTAPDPVVSTTTADDADAAAAGAVIDLLRELDVLLQTLGAAPVSELRSGGLGIRDVKRLAKTTGIDEPRLGLLLEIAAAAGLIAAGMPDPEPADGAGLYWAPTMATERFGAMPATERWHLLAGTWLDLPGRPTLIGSRGPDAKPYGALTDSLYSTAAPLDRRLLLGMLAELPPGAGVDAAAASTALIWRRPRWARRLQPQPVADLLAESHALGLVGRGAISAAGRALLDEAGDPNIAVRAMNRAMPAPIDHFLVQADLTVVVPGPLRRDLADDLAAVATVESAGTAMVYRVSEQSIRHALDIGKTRDWMHELFGRHSKTPVPQGLTYLIDDVARRHGQLRIGMAASFVRCEDPTLLAQAVAATAEQLQLRALAPTVAVSPAPIAEVLAALRSAGFAPAAEDSSGSIVDVRPRGARVPTPQRRRPYRPPPRPSNETLNAVISVLRKVTAAPFGNIRVDPAVTMSLLQRAAKEQDTLVIGYLDAAGVATQRVVSPITVRGGQLVAFDSASGRLRDFAIHRITSVVSAAD